MYSNKHYCQVSNMRRTLVGNKIVDHSDVVGASPIDAAQTTSSFSTPGLKGLGKDDFKTRWESFQFWDSVWLILETLRYSGMNTKGFHWGLVNFGPSIGLVPSGNMGQQAITWTSVDLDFQHHYIGSCDMATMVWPMISKAGHNV